MRQPLEARNGHLRLDGRSPAFRCPCCCPRSAPASPMSALPTLAQAFDASFQEVQWIVLAYLLAITSLIVGVGRLGDITGRRRLLLAGVFLFTVGLGAVRRRARAVAADRRSRGAGARSGHHDGPHDRLCRRDGSEGKDRQRHGAARNDVRDRHRPGAIARRRPDRRHRLAGDLPRQRTAGHPDLASCAIATCPSITGSRRPNGPASTMLGALLLALTLAAYALAMTARARQLRPRSTSSCCWLRPPASASSCSSKREPHRP